METRIYQPAEITDDIRQSITRIGAESFGVLPTFDAQLHERVDKASAVQMGYLGEVAVAVAVYNHQEDGSLLLAARGVDKEHQGQGYGAKLLDAYLAENPEVHEIETYTRNPAIIAMLGKVATVLPYASEEYKQRAEHKSHVTLLDDAGYHLERYPTEGIYSIDDPAKTAHKTTGVRLVDNHPHLQSEQNALYIAATRQ